MKRKAGEGKVAVITGATSGIGLATAKLFLSNGFAVYGIARKPYAGDDFVCYSADVCDYAAIDGILADICSKHGHIDVFVNNAGFGIAGAVEDCSIEQIERITDVNFTAVCVLCGKVVPLMKEKGGRIINVSSVGGIMPLPYQAMYSATKSAVEVFSRALANEVKPYNIKVTAVLPGDTRTGFTSARVVEGENSAAQKSIQKMSRDEQNGKSPESVAKVILRAAVKRNPPLRMSVGFASKAEVFAARLVSAKLLNGILDKMYGGK